MDFMNKKYYANIDLYFTTMKHSIVGETNMKKQEIIDSVEDFAKARKLTCNKKARKLYDASGKEVGSYEVLVRLI